MNASEIREAVSLLFDKAEKLRHNDTAYITIDELKENVEALVNRAVAEALDTERTNHFEDDLEQGKENTRLKREVEELKAFIEKQSAVIDVAQPIHTKSLETIDRLVKTAKELRCALSAYTGVSDSPLFSSGQIITRLESAEILKIREALENSLWVEGKQ